MSREGKIYKRGGKPTERQRRDEPRAALREVWLVITLVFFLPTSMILTLFFCVAMTFPAC